MTISPRQVFQSPKSIAFQGQEGINIMWPFMGPVINESNMPTQPYDNNPFTNPSNFLTHCPPETLKMLVNAGYDFVRLGVSPGPWMDAVNDAVHTEFLFTLLDTAINAIIAAGLGVNLDMHDIYYIRNTPTDILNSPSLFATRLTVTQRFASRYSRIAPNKLALEMFNEPPDHSLFPGPWKTYLDHLYNTARAAMPKHTLFLTMDDYSNVTKLITANPGNYDNNTLWVLHPYLPPIFCLQGYNQSSFSKYVSGFNWPPIQSEKTGLIARMTTAVNADNSLTSPQKTAQIASSLGDINNFYDIPQGRSNIEYDLQTVVTWCISNHISPNRVICNEYGVTRTNVAFTGAPEASRVAWITNMSDMLTRRGFRKAIFALDAIDYGITSGVGQNIGEINIPLYRRRKFVR